MTYIRCVHCGTLDFDALFDLRFKNQLCCKYVLVDATPVSVRQTVLFWRGARPGVIDHWSNYVSGD